MCCQGLENYKLVDKKPKLQSSYSIGTKDKYLAKRKLQDVLMNEWNENRNGYTKHT